ncbi:hypothetical protein GCM10009037_10360 [Halarchaeum grantii]|uniref:Archaeal Type IV pilin N-terminal domain-containing protein n=1 Tax=Halarchaeum grantii TaxID=1193105 RepID=A0A830F0W4_9EURY|nr:type IV pilin N-terminal domain-containing protein [Halarchaeum grantii]GGL28638.1 hypothetical protein GCM10009037_10360 [Halarchaeum grantii]
MTHTSRGVAPVVGVVLLLACCVGAASAVAVTVTDAGSTAIVTPATPSVVDAHATSDGTLALTYRAGPALDVRDLRVVVAVGGTPLRQQPTVPFVGAPGFDGAPGGPFNAATDPTWTVGERATLRLAGTNTALDAGARVTIRLYRNGTRIAVVETRVVTARERARAS